MPADTGPYYPTAWFAAMVGDNSNSTFFTTNAGVPGSTFVSLLRLDTTNKHLYAWDGTQYVKVSDYA